MEPVITVGLDERERVFLYNKTLKEYSRLCKLPFRKGERPSVRALELVGLDMLLKKLEKPSDTDSPDGLRPTDANR